jgi:RNA polymerase sigma-70 factor (ECF subfamily)
MTLDDALPHLPRLRRHARLLAGDAARADDLLQDTLERAARKAALWRPPADGDPSTALRAWLLTLMHHLYLNQRRDEHAHLMEPYTGEQDPLHEPVRQWQARIDLERALALLPDAAREVLLLVCVEQLSYEATAQVLGVPVGTVMSRLSRARERLRRLMEGGGTSSPGLRVVKP